MFSLYKVEKIVNGLENRFGIRKMFIGWKDRLK